MPVRTTASIEAISESEKRKFVSSRFRQTECHVHRGCTAALVMTERKIRQGKQIVVSRHGATIARRHSSVGKFNARLPRKR